MNSWATLPTSPGPGTPNHIPNDTPGQRAVFGRDPGALDKRLVHWPVGRFGGGITEAFTVPD